MFEIEISEPRFSECDCCGKRLTNLTRFVTRDKRAWAIYHATFGESHPEKGVYLATGIDDVGDTPDWIGRSAFALWLSAQEDGFRTTVIDKVDSPWSGSKVLGRMLDREEALSHPWIKEVFHLVDHIVEKDPAIKGLFETVH